MMEATKGRMMELRLHGMLQAYEALQAPGQSKDLSPEELITHLVETEYTDRASRRLATRIRQARLRYPATFEQVSLGGVRQEQRGLLLKLSRGEWIRKAENVIITGKTGVGKSFIACALGHRACAQEQRVMYFSTGKLFAELEMAKADRTHIRFINRIRSQNLIVLDDFGLSPLAGDSRLQLFELLEDRYGLGSTIIVSQIPVDRWHELIKDTTLADAICDRLIHNAHRLELGGPSIRPPKEHSPTK